MKDELIRYRGVTNTLEQLIKTTIDIDNKLYKRAIEKHYNNPYSRVGTYIGKSEYRGGKPKFQGRKTTYSNPYRPQPIELDSTQQRKGKNPRGSKGNKNPKTYYNYSKPGHFAREYRSIKVLRRQLNATLKVPDD